VVASSWARLFAAEASCALDEALEARLEARIDEARAAWPRVALPVETFVRHLARHAAKSGVSPAAFVDLVHAPDLWLACAVAARDRVALAAFEEHLMSRVPAFVMRVRVGRDAVDEVQQKLRERLLLGDPPKITEYTGKGALAGWLRVAAVRTALNEVRGEAAHRRGADDEAAENTPALAGDPELAYVKERAQDLFTDAFRRVLAGLDANERTILRLHYLEGLTMDQLAHLYKTPRSTIARRVAEARKAILEATEAMLRDERRLSPSAVASVIRDAKSRLEVTLTRLLE